MGLFSKKKEQKETQNIPPLKFPELPKEEFPSYEPAAGSELQTIKEAVQPREPEQVVEPAPAMSTAPLMMASEEQPLFVKIEKYKDAIKTINQLKEKLDDAERLLDELNSIKEQEERELRSWHQDLEDIKQKLMLVDQKLFEQ